MNDAQIIETKAEKDINAVVIKTYSKLHVSKTASHVKLWNVPQRNVNFIGRHQLLSEIKIKLKTDTHFKLRPVVITACHGLGGIGKTQLALEYIYQNDSDYELICWVPAEKSADIESAYLALAQELRIAPQNAKPNDILNLLKDMMGRTKTLVVFDNAPNYETIEKYVPTICTDILITSRHTEWLDKGIEVNVFNAEEARQYIEKILDIRTTGACEDINELADLLGRLPLALAQASAYIKQNHMLINEYIALYKNRQKELLAKETLPIGDKHEAVYVTWDITIHAISKLSPLAHGMLICCAYFSNENIPCGILEAFAKKEKDKQSNKVFEESIGLLNSYSMIAVDPQNQLLSLHRLVQEITLLKLIPTERHAFALKAFNAISSKLPYCLNQVEHVRLKQLLSPHFEKVLTELERTAQTTTDDVQETLGEHVWHCLLYLNDCCEALCNLNKSCNTLERILSIEKAFKDEHKRYTRMSITLAKLSSKYYELGNFEKARLLLEETKLCDQNVKRFLWKGFESSPVESDNEQTATDQISSELNAMDFDEICNRHNFANIYGAFGDKEQQLILLEEAMAKVKNYYLKKHQFHLRLLDNRRSISKNPDHELDDNICKQAEGYKQITEDFKKVVIYDKYFSKEIATLLTSLGHFSHEHGRISEGVKLLEDALSILQSYFGDTSPELISVLCKLGGISCTQGFTSKGCKLLKDALALSIKWYGESHHETGVILCKLGDIYNRHCSDPSMALVHLTKAFSIIQHTLPANHPKLATCAHNLSSTYLSLQNYPQAELYAKIEVDICKHNFGERHSEFANSLSHLAYIYTQAGKHEKACRLFIQAFHIHLALHGENHPTIAKGLIDFAMYCEWGNKIDLAFKFTAKAHDIYMELPSHGPTNQHTMNALMMRSMLGKQKQNQSNHSHFTAILHGIIFYLNTLINREIALARKLTSLDFLWPALIHCFVFIRFSLNNNGQEFKLSTMDLAFISVTILGLVCISLYNGANLSSLVWCVSLVVLGNYSGTFAINKIAAWWNKENLDSIATIASQLNCLASMKTSLDGTAAGQDNAVQTLPTNQLRNSQNIGHYFIHSAYHLYGLFSTSLHRRQSPQQTYDSKIEKNKVNNQHDVDLESGNRKHL